MITFDTIIYQTLFIRQGAVRLLSGLTAEQGDAMPPTWSNNARWHAGHLVLTPACSPARCAASRWDWTRTTASGLPRGPRRRDWGADPVPRLEELLPRITAGSEELFTEFRDKLDEPYSTPYTTSTGATLKTPGEALNFSLAHDAIHLGMLLVLRRQLAAA